MTDISGLKERRENFQLKILDLISVNYMWDEIFRNNNYTESLLQIWGNLIRNVKRIKQMGINAIINSRKYRKLYKKEISS